MDDFPFGRQSIDVGADEHVDTLAIVDGCIILSENGGDDPWNLFWHGLGWTLFKFNDVRHRICKIYNICFSNPEFIRFNFI